MRLSLNSTVMCYLPPCKIRSKPAETKYAPIITGPPTTTNKPHRKKNTIHEESPFRKENTSTKRTKRQKHHIPQQPTNYERLVAMAIPVVPIPHHPPPTRLQEALMREGRSKSRERRQAAAGLHTPGPGGGGGRAGEEAHQAAAENRKSWTGQRQRRKSKERPAVEG